MIIDSGLFIELNCFSFNQFVKGTETMEIKLAILNLIVLVIISNANASNDLPLDLIKSHLPKEFAGANLNNFNVSDAKNLLRTKCKKNLQNNEDVDEIYNSIESATTELTECFSKLFNLTSIQEEIEIAKPIGELDTVFVKHCSHRTEAETCIVNFNSKIQPCLDREEKAGNVVMMRVVHSMFDFLCYKGGDQIALFYAEKGPECLDDNKMEIGHCLNTTLQGYSVSEGIPDMNSIVLPQLVLGPKQCTDMIELEKCIVKHLETCEEITPSNIAASMFKFVSKEAQCGNSTVNAKTNSRNSSTSNVISVAVFLVLLLSQKLLN